MSMFLTKSAKFSFVGFLIFFSFHLTAQAEICPSLLQVKSLTAKQTIEPNKLIRVRVALASNKVRFWAIDTLIKTPESGLAIGQSLEIPNAVVCVNTQQLDQLIQFFPNANLGLNILVEQKISPLTRFMAYAETLFLQPSAGSGIILQIENFGTSRLANGNVVFDPRLMADSRLFQINNQNLELGFEISEQTN